jgi:hypothetical protein
MREMFLQFTVRDMRKAARRSVRNVTRSKLIYVYIYFLNFQHIIMVARGTRADVDVEGATSIRNLIKSLQNLVTAGRTLNSGHSTCKCFTILSGTSFFPNACHLRLLIWISLRLILKNTQPLKRCFGNNRTHISGIPSNSVCLNALPSSTVLLFTMWNKSFFFSRFEYRLCVFVVPIFFWICLC